MKLTLGMYEHSRIGFPGVVLKWCVENGKISPPYLVVKGIITNSYGCWNRQWPLSAMEAELAEFDKWVGQMYSNDASVQG